MSRFIRNKKAKGTNAENFLIHKFWESEWVAVRVAGSGSTKYPAPDILASCGYKKIVMEIKVTNSSKKYFSQKEILDLEFFGEKFGAESWVGIKFEENQWFFIPTNELIISAQGNYSISLIEIKRKGFTFEEMIGKIN